MPRRHSIPVRNESQSNSYELAAIQKQTTSGKTAQRDELSQGMVELALDVANAVAAHADEHQLIELAKSVGVSAGTFARLRILHRPILAQQIHDTAQPVVAELEPYGVTAETLAALQAQIGLVKAWLDQPRSLIRSKSSATAQLAETFREADALLEGQIDRLVFPLRKIQPKFYADYQRARQILDDPGTRSSAGDATPATQTPPGRRGRSVGDAHGGHGRQSGLSQPKPSELRPQSSDLRVALCAGVI